MGDSVVLQGKDITNVQRNNEFNRKTEEGSNLSKDTEDTTAKDSASDQRNLRERLMMEDSTSDALTERKPVPLTVSPRRWVVLLACCFTYAFSGGFPFNMSIIFVELLGAFGKSFAETSLVLSFCSGTVMISGFISGMLIGRLGPRRVGMAGGILAALGIVISFFAQSIEFLIVAAIPTGFGLSAIFVSSTACIGDHFDGKAKQIALAIGSYCSGVGALSMTPLMKTFTEKYSWRGYFLIMGGICLNAVPCFAVCRHRDIDKTGVICKVENLQKKRSMVEILKSIRNKPYILIVAGLVVPFPALNAVMGQAIDMLMDKGLTKDQAVQVFLTKDIVGIVVRVIPVVLKFIPHFSIIGIPIIYCVLGTVVLFCFPYCYGYYYILVLLSCLEASRGGLVISNTITISKIVPNYSYSTACGILMSLQGFCNFAVTPLFGYLRDATGSYNVPLFTAGGLLGCSCLFLFTALFIRKKTGMGA